MPTMRGMELVRLSILARLCWALEARRWLLSLGNVIAATLFVIGCVGFYIPMWYVGSVTLFLVGSLLFLLSALGHALVEHGPST
jgi:YrhK-like protein